MLDKPQILRVISRISHQIHENNYLEKNIKIVGVRNTGYTLAEMISVELDKISSAKVQLFDIKIDKKNPATSTIELGCDAKVLKNSVVILVDDVLNTGRTFLYCFKPFLNANVKKLETVVLIDRNHSLFPISATYCGFELATTLEDHVKVMLSEKDTGVYLV